MKHTLQKNFLIDRKNKTISVKREFDAPVDMVWSAWTESELLDLWWAPKPWKSETKKMDFREGGRRLYAMVSPDGEKHWSFADYKSITPKSNLKYRDGFCDSEGVLNQHLPESDWNVDFIKSDGLTIVNIDILHEQLTDLEITMQMGFKKGIISILDELAEILPSMSKK